MSKPKVKIPITPSRHRVVDTQPDVEDRRAPIVVHSCDDHLHASVPHNPRLYDYVPGEGLFIREGSRPEPEAVRVGDETPLTLDQYQQQAKATAVYPDGKADQYLIAGLAGEVGEFASLFAKHWRGDGDLIRDNLKAELGDVLWFVAMLAEHLDTDLSEVAQGNLDKLADRANRGKLKGNGDNR